MQDSRKNARQVRAPFANPYASFIAGVVLWVIGANLDQLLRWLPWFPSGPHADIAFAFVGLAVVGVFVIGFHPESKQNYPFEAGLDRGVVLGRAMLQLHSGLGRVVSFCLGALVGAGLSALLFRSVP
jgi:hypothetical protein